MAWERVTKKESIMAYEEINVEAWIEKNKKGHYRTCIEYTELVGDPTEDIVQKFYVDWKASPMWCYEFITVVTDWIDKGNSEIDMCNVLRSTNGDDTYFEYLGKE